MPQAAATPPAPPAPPAQPAPPAPSGTPTAVAPAANGQVTVVGVTGTPQEVFQGLRAQRRELGRQLEQLEERRHTLSSRLQEPAVRGADRAGLEARIGELDRRILDVERQMSDADVNVAKAAALPGATVEPRQPREPGPPEEVFVLAGIFIVVVLLPLSIAYARRIWRRAAGVLPSLPGELLDRLGRLEQSVDAVALEVERIGEGQRFLTHRMIDAPRTLDATSSPTMSADAQERLPVRR